MKSMKCMDSSRVGDSGRHASSPGESCLVDVGPITGPGPRTGLWSHWRRIRVTLQSRSDVEPDVSLQAWAPRRKSAARGPARPALRCALESGPRGETGPDRGAPVSGGAAAARDPGGGGRDPPRPRSGRRGQPVHRVSRPRPGDGRAVRAPGDRAPAREVREPESGPDHAGRVSGPAVLSEPRSEEHTSELQSQSNLVCRLL